MSKYNKSVIYKIRCEDDNIIEFYLGSSINFKRRILQHKKACYNKCKKSYHNKLYSFMRQTGGFDNFEFIELEKIVCNNKYELLQKEQKYIDELKPLLNTNNSYKFNLQNIEPSLP